MMRILLFAALTMAVAGCAQTVVNPNIISRTANNYRINEEMVATIGSPIIQIQRIKEHPAFIVSKDFKALNGNEFQDSDFKKGHKFWVHKVNQDGNLYLRSDEMNPKLAIKISPNGKVDTSTGDGWVILVTGPNSGTIETSNTYVKTLDSANWPQDLLFERSETGYPVKGSFMAEIIYSGKTDNSIKAVYREYLNDLARPAFHQELIYNLKESDIIAYKTITIKVLNATNSHLKYKVISDGNLPWVPVK